MATTLQTYRDALDEASFMDKSNTVKDRWINRGVQRISSVLDKQGNALPFLDGSATVTVATTGIGSLPNDFSKAKSVVSTATPPVKLGPLSHDDFVARQTLGDIANIDPISYTIYNNSLMVSPAPPTSKNYSLAYVKTVPLLTSGSDEPLVPERYRHLCHMAALSYAYGETDETEQASLLEKQLETEIAQMVADLSVRYTDRGENVATVNTLGYFTQKVRDHGFNVSNSSVQEALNMSVNDIWNYKGTNWSWASKEGFVVGSASGHPELIAIPEDLDKLSAVYDVTSNRYFKLDRINYSELQKRIMQTGSPQRGDAYYYSVYGSDIDGSQQVRVYPIPYDNNHQYELWYDCKPVLFTTSDSVAPIPAAYSQALLYGALSRIALMVPERLKDASTFQSVFQTELDAMHTAEQMKNLDNPDNIIEETCWW